MRAAGRRWRRRGLLDGPRSRCGGRCGWRFRGRCGRRRRGRCRDQHRGRRCEGIANHAREVRRHQDREPLHRAHHGSTSPSKAHAVAALEQDACVSSPRITRENHCSHQVAPRDYTPSCPIPELRPRVSDHRAMLPCRRASMPRPPRSRARPRRTALGSARTHPRPARPKRRPPCPGELLEDDLAMPQLEMKQPVGLDIEVRLERRENERGMRSRDDLHRDSRVHLANDIQQRAGDRHAAVRPESGLACRRICT